MFIQVAELRKSYPSGNTRTDVLKGISMSLEQGEIGVILGPSGSGKSTLLHILGGLDGGDSGEVRVDGVDISRLHDQQLAGYRRERIGYVFQFYNLIPNLTVGENVEVATYISKSPLALDRVLEAVGLLDKKNRFPTELSGGEQQRVAIARAVVKNPRLLLCDEPTGALDSATSRDILELLQHVNRTYGTTILIITHNTAISRMAHRVFKMKDGAILEQAVNETVISAERMEWE
ncbi:ABC transporter ATP-binding protein [Cohnella sp. REN36]|uniref:ABC transporter ATP-binding protein n=1 Tax=Cohnella sp. REN36 TaxID=2887347 RepID=UPI001D1594A0|nr:ABC transporter ATP-binding protein [Cohnella sp. REN36]MCC3372060.1 ABC transporter ATP-binding protein [Cohnella sp. REN36]